jgi:hypothetical protein
VYGITVTPLGRQRDISLNISQKLRTNGAVAPQALSAHHLLVGLQESESLCLLERMAAALS